MLTWAHMVDRNGTKIVNLLLTCLLGAGGMVIAALLNAFWLALIGITIAVIGVTTARAVFWRIPARFLSGAAAAGVLAFINSVGTFGGFAGPFLVGWLKDRTGSFAMGMLGMAAGIDGPDGCSEVRGEGRISARCSHQCASSLIRHSRLQHSSACFSTATICSIEKRFRFMTNHLLVQGEACRKTRSRSGPGNPSGSIDARLIT
ncbi:MFS transporter [Burkholderia stagnalis]|uniref:MFS transporter n=1 Tax=Burkholderia stagnalis TaxID=1503054 RepID=A0A6L3MP58_9BURK|nr:MFS transporter [Burkholderia stagnalis]KAB0633796.1 MFS transporter [Burkholderia stagnalis]